MGGVVYLEREGGRGLLRERPETKTGDPSLRWETACFKLISVRTGLGWI